MVALQVDEPLAAALAPGAASPGADARAARLAGRGEAGHGLSPGPRVAPPFSARLPHVFRPDGPRSEAAAPERANSPSELRRPAAASASAEPEGPQAERQTPFCELPPSPAPAWPPRRATSARKANGARSGVPFSVRDEPPRSAHRPAPEVPSADADAPAERVNKS